MLDNNSNPSTPHLIEQVISLPTLPLYSTPYMPAFRTASLAHRRERADAAKPYTRTAGNRPRTAGNRITRSSAVDTTRIRNALLPDIFGRIADPPIILLSNKKAAQISRAVYQGRSFQQSYSLCPGVFHFETYIIQGLLRTLSPIPESNFITCHSGLHLWCAIRRVDDRVGARAIEARVNNCDLGMMPTIIVPLYLILQEDIANVNTRELSEGFSRSRQYLGPYWSSIPGITAEHREKARILRHHVQSRLPAPAASPTPISPPATSPLPSPWPLCPGPAVEIEKDTDRGSSNDGDGLVDRNKAQEYENRGPEKENHEIRIGSPTLERKDGSEEREGNRKKRRTRFRFRKIGSKSLSKRSARSLSRTTSTLRGFRGVEGTQVDSILMSLKEDSSLLSTI